jgi:hypothetical protein
MTLINLATVLDSALDQVEAKKLDRLREVLERTLKARLESLPFSDPIAMRRTFVNVLKGEGVSDGVIHHYEQLFMGVIRRAAVKGLIEPPPEGPWTAEWQAVLTVAAKMRLGKATIRSLAAWATQRGIGPRELAPEHLAAWIRETMSPNKLAHVAQEAISSWKKSGCEAGAGDAERLAERLKKKAIYGSVRA